MEEGVEPVDRAVYADSYRGDTHFVEESGNASWHEVGGTAWHAFTDVADVRAVLVRSMVQLQFLEHGATALVDSLFLAGDIQQMHIIFLVFGLLD